MHCPVCHGMYANRPPNIPDHSMAVNRLAAALSPWSFLSVSFAPLPNTFQPAPFGFTPIVLLLLPLAAARRGTPPLLFPPRWLPSTFSVLLGAWVPPSSACPLYKQHPPVAACRFRPWVRPFALSRPHHRPGTVIHFTLLRSILFRLLILFLSVCPSVHLYLRTPMAYHRIPRAALSRVAEIRLAAFLPKYNATLSKDTAMVTAAASAPFFFSPFFPASFPLFDSRGCRALRSVCSRAGRLGGSTSSHPCS